MSRSLDVLVIVSLCLVLLLASSGADARWSAKREAAAFPIFNSPSDMPYVPGEVIVKLHSGVTLTRGLSQSVRADEPLLDAALTQVGAREAVQLFDSPQIALGLTRVYRLKLDATADVMTAVAALSADPSVEYAEPNYIARAAGWDAADVQRISGYGGSHPLIRLPSVAITLPNDPLYSSQWGLEKINAASAWDVVTGTPAAVIAVVDSGIDLAHSDLAGQLWINPGEIPGNGVDDDNNGYVDDVNGWNFVSGSNNISDGNGHGTQVAGVIGAATNNGTGIAGLCWNCRIMPVRVMADSGAANYSDIAAGVAYAAAKGAKVINLSLGGYASSNALRDAINAAAAQGTVVVGGAGNDNTSALFYPAAYENVLAVAGTTITDTKATFSNYGTWVDVSAPGETITTTFLGGDYGPASGTSLSAPFVSGLAGLIRSRWPTWTEVMVRNQILRTTDAIDSLNPGYAGQLGTGRIDAAAAMQDPHPLLTLSGASVNGDPQGQPTPGVGATLAVALRNDWQDATGVTGVLNTTDAYVTMLNGAASYGTIVAGDTGTSSPVYSFTVASGAGYNHPIAFTLAVTANAGTYTTTIPLTVTTRSGDEPFCGTIAQDTIWTSDKTYVINCNMGIAPGYTLTIQPGTQVKFNGNYVLNVGGTLIADGTESQPIRFTSNSGSAWNRIYFDDPSTDATVDTNYEYVSGSILRYVTVDRASGGIVCNYAAPYLSHVTSNSSSLNCAIGTSTLLFLDNTISGTVNVTVSLYYPISVNVITPTIIAVRNTIIGGGLNVIGDVIGVTGPGIALSNTVSGGSISVGNGGTIVGNTVSGGDLCGGRLSNPTYSCNLGYINNPLTVYNNTVIGGGLGTGDTATVINNKFTNGGITVGKGSLVHNNDVTSASGWGISASDSMTVTHNRVVANDSGIKVDGGLVQGNLIANNSGIGLQIGSAMVLSNTFTGNGGSSIKIASGTSVTISGNNLEGNTGLYDIEDTVSMANLPSVAAQGNWWGTTSSAAIGQRIYDFSDDYNLGTVLYSPVLTQPSPDAPAFVRAITLTPASPVGIQTVTFDMLFSRNMDTGGNPAAAFYTTLRDTWQTYSTTNSGLANNRVGAIAVDAAGNKWFGTSGDGVSVLRADGTWQTYNTSNSGLVNNLVSAIAVDAAGNKWFGTEGGGVSVLRADGTWQTHNTSNSGLGTNFVLAIARDAAGSTWFGGISTGDDGGASVLRADGTWQTYNTSNSGLTYNSVSAIAVDAAGNKWFGTEGGGASVLHADGTWQTYNTSNSGLANNYVRAIAVDAAGNKWFGSGGVSVLRVDGNWQTYNTSNSGLASDNVRTIAVDAAGNKWFGLGYPGNSYKISELQTDGTWHTYSIAATPGQAIYNVDAIAIDAANNKWFGADWSGVQVLYGGTDYPIVDNAHWLSPTTQYRATFDFSTFVPRGTYSITVSGARGTDGIEIAPYSGITFTVAYAGAINDTTPPPAPSINACGAISPDTLSARWNVTDPESAITLYRYAIGTTPGGSDVVNWTNTSLTSTTRASLTLIAGQTYYVSVKARNEGGLWSVAGVSTGVVAGSGGCPAAGFVASPTSGPAPLTVTFGDASGGNITSRIWDFGDTFTSTLAGPTHVYSAAGVYTVSLQVAGPGGSDSLMRASYITVTTPVSIPAPAASFTASPRTGVPPLTVYFTDTSTGTVTSWLWQFGDGLTGTLSSPTHTYRLTGTFDVTLTVTGPGGSDVEVKTAYIRVWDQYMVYLPLVIK